MIVLALDTALAAAQAAVLDGDAVLAAETRPMATGHAEALVPLVEAVLASAGKRYADLDRIAATVGPGSFAGVRIALSAARALGLALGKPVVGVTTLAALAFGRGEATAVIDARRNGIYLQQFSFNAAMGEASVQSVAEAAAALPRDARLVGSGAPLLAALRPDATVLAAPAYPPIEAVARLGRDLDPAAAPPRPLYLRPPDAKPQGPALARRA
jgi:tRNA threonylcarbamoyladenosine biosynthesis protein TsaB